MAERKSRRDVSKDELHGLAQDGVYPSEKIDSITQKAELANAGHHLLRVQIAKGQPLSSVDCPGSYRPPIVTLTPVSNPHYIGAELIRVSGTCSETDCGAEFLFATTGGIKGPNWTQTQ